MTLSRNRGKRSRDPQGRAPPRLPPEEGRYLRGNDLSPVAVVAILDTYDFRIPPELTAIVQAMIESGAALARAQGRSQVRFFNPFFY